MNAPKTTVAWDSYWRLAFERQRVFFRRLRGAWPLTEDPVLLRHRFTNAYRASDRVSQALIRVAWSGSLAPEEVFFRTLLFRLFNKEQTWALLQRELGPLRWEGFEASRADAVLTAAMARGERIYSAAYVMPARGPGLQDRRKHRNHLALLVRMLDAELPARLQEAPSAEAAFRLLRAWPMIGDFLAYQLLVDLGYGPLLDFSEMDFVVPGPGALSGLRKCFADPGGRTPAELIRYTTERQEEELDRRGLPFEDLFGRRLQLIDAQNLFCEVDKYSRVAHPQLSGRGGRAKIKRLYRPDPRPMPLWYPPSWGLAERIPEAWRGTDPRISPRPPSGG